MPMVLSSDERWALRVVAARAHRLVESGGLYRRWRLPRRDEWEPGEFVSYSALARQSAAASHRAGLCPPHAPLPGRAVRGPVSRWIRAPPASAGSVPPAPAPTRAPRRVCFRERVAVRLFDGRAAAWRVRMLHTLRFPLRAAPPPSAKCRAVRAVRLPRSLRDYWQRVGRDEAVLDEAEDEDVSVLEDYPPPPADDDAPGSVLGDGAAHALERVRRHSAPLAAGSRCAPLPPPLRVPVLRRWAPRVAQALSQLPPLRDKPPPPRPSYVVLPRGCMREVRRHTAVMLPGAERACASLFAVPKVSKPELRLITDARNANAMLARPVQRLAVRPPTVDELASFLSRARYAATSDFRNYFHAFRIGRPLRTFFYVPSLGRSLSVLPMGFLPASDWAAAATGAIADLPVRGGLRVPVAPSRARVGVTFCADNILVAGPSRASVAERTAVITARADEIRATFSAPFAPPARDLVYYGVNWHLSSSAPTRGLPVDKALKARRLLLAFAKSRGPQSARRWAAVCGTASWVGTVCSVDVTRRYALIHGTRVAVHRGDVVPGASARAEARRHAEAAMRRVPMRAPASFVGPRVPLSSLPLSSAIYVSDAASPGACAVLHFAPGSARARLVHFRRVPASEPALFAELSGVREAAAHAAARRYQRPVYVTDALAVVHMIRRGVARNVRHADALVSIRSSAPAFYVVWIPTAVMQLAVDPPSRASSHARASALTRFAVPLERLLEAAQHNAAGPAVAFRVEV